MGTVRVVRTKGVGPTRIAAYDAALAAVDLHNYNLVPVSSIIPASASVETVDSLPDLGPAGHQLWVVEAKAVNSRPVSAGLAWVKPSDDSGVIYEAAGPTNIETIRERLRCGLTRGLQLRSRDIETESLKSLTISARPEVDEGYAAAVVLAVYGSGHPIL